MIGMGAFRKASEEESSYSLIWLALHSFAVSLFDVAWILDVADSKQLNGQRLNRMGVRPHTFVVVSASVLVELTPHWSEAYNQCCSFLAPLTLEVKRSS